MLRTDLINIVNTDKTWAFIGSGVSADSSCPTWKELIEKIIGNSEVTLRNKILQDNLFKKAFENKNYPKSFSRINHYIGRETLEDAVINEIDKIKMPGNLALRLADWPFAGYITTNYNGLLETALQKIGEIGWASIGNSQDEVRKVSGGATNLIWHIHGFIKMEKDKSRLILTEEDYDEIYLSDSPIKTQLRSLLAQHRVIFIGFSFQDEEVKRLLKEVGRLSSPVRPVFAFLSHLYGMEFEAEREELLKKYNVEVIPYKVTDNSYDKLSELLDVYESMILRRSLKFGQPFRPCPSYDQQTTGLLIYNELCLKEHAVVSEDIVGSLLRARVLSLLKYKSSCTILDLIEDLNERFKIIQGKPPSSQSIISQLQKSIEELISSELISIEDVSNSNSQIILTTKGKEKVANQAATAERLASQFSASIEDRASMFFPEDGDAASRVANTAETFLKECIQKRALGVAQIIEHTLTKYQIYHMVALLQSLPDFMVQLLKPEEAIALTKLIQEILSKPSEAEKKYIGLALQAQFGIHLLGYDPVTLQQRANDLRNTLFLVDSTTLIPFLARSSIGYNSSRFLIKRFKEDTSFIATTTLLAWEVAEHANWALKKTDQSTGRLKIETLEALTGRSGYKENAFLGGFIEEINKGSVLDFGNYLNQVCATPKGSISCSLDDIQRTLMKEGIYFCPFEGWEGFTQDLWSDRDELQKKIAELRKERKTYKHERQVKAEAEALIIIRKLRDKSFKINNQNVTNAYFISHTRVIDELGGGYRITMRPEAIQQWVTTISPFNLEELGFLTDSLLWELAEGHFSIVDKSRLQLAFSPFIDASKEKLQEVTERHRILISQRYGEETIKAFNESNNLDTPIILESLYAQIAESLGKELQLEKKLRESVQRGAKLSDKERKELVRLQAKERKRKLKALSKKRAAESRKGKKKKKR